MVTNGHKRIEKELERDEAKGGNRLNSFEPRGVRSSCRRRRHRHRRRWMLRVTDDVSQSSVSTDAFATLSLVRIQIFRSQKIVTIFSREKSEKI